jgi:hypothetical protein
MNGGGKTELRSDPTHRASFIGHVGNTVHLSVKGPPGAAIASASYANRELAVSADGQHFSLQIAVGIATLTVVLDEMILPGIHSLVEEQNLLARFEDTIVTLTILGE